MPLIDVYFKSLPPIHTTSFMDKKNSNAQPRRLKTKTSSTRLLVLSPASFPSAYSCLIPSSIYTFISHHSISSLTYTNVTATLVLLYSIGSFSSAALHAQVYDYDSYTGASPTYSQSSVKSIMIFSYTFVHPYTHC